MTYRNDIKMNIIFMANISYPKGMASTRRVQNLIDHFRGKDDVHQTVLVLRQGRVKLAENKLCGCHKGVEYVTIGGDIKPDITVLWKGVKYFVDGLKYLKANLKKQCTNIIYVYGYPTFDNVPLLMFAKALGYRIVFDIVEDAEFMGSAPDILARLKRRSGIFFYNRIGSFADAVLVISKHLYEKTVAVVKGKLPVMLYPISVNFENFNYPGEELHRPVRVFYGGTFGTKDGVENLIEAFEGVCAKHGEVELFLSGKGAKDRMDAILEQITNSPYKDKIKCTGYLDDAEFYEFMNGCDILCMTRVESRFADTGFPFKLGEYLAAGKAVVASDVSDVTDYLEDRVNAVVVKPGSVSDIAEGISFLIENPEAAREMGARAKVTARENFDSTVSGEKIYELLREL
ncbi:MAG TPA: glycosyltransferase [Phycisphaerales bacterium]|nr:glycosyltransferase [Phycisphaerales bacterium]